MRNVLIGSVFVGTTVFVFWPMLSSIQTVTTSAADGPLIAFLVEHARQWLSGQSPLYDVPFFYPFKNTLTYSDPFLSSGLMALVVRQLWPGASLIAQVNLQLVAGTIIYLLSLYWLIRTLGGRGAAAILLSVIGTFVPLRFVYVVHVHTHLIFAIPLSIACFIHYNQSGQKRFLLGFAAAYLFQMANAPMTAYFFMITIALYALFQRQWWGTLIRDRWQQLVFAGLLFLSVALYLPYWSQAASEQSFRTIRDAAHFSYSIERLCGWDVVALVSFTIVLFVTMRKSKKTLRQLLPWWCIALVGLVAMLGPVVKVDEQTLRVVGFPIPLPYALAFYVVPGIKAFRSVTRWSVVGSIGLIGAAAVQLRHTRIRPTVIAAVLALLAGWSVWSASQYLPVFSIPTAVPDSYQRAAEQPEQTMVILPAYVWDMQPYAVRESERLLYQPTAGKQYFNGASGYLPPTRAEAIHQLYRQFPDDQAVALLKENQIELILVEYDQYAQMFADNFRYGDVLAPNPQAVRIKLSQRDDVVEIGCDEHSCLYRLR